MNDETTGPNASVPAESRLPAPGERLGRSRRRDRRGKGNRDHASSTLEPGAPSADKSESAQQEQKLPPPAANTIARPQEFKRQRGQQGFGDGVDRQICAFCVPVLAETYPVQGRPGIAVAAYRVIAEIDGSQLICNQLHVGECAWADLTPIDPDEAVSRNWSVVVVSGPESIDDYDQHAQDDDTSSV